VHNIFSIVHVARVMCDNEVVATRVIAYSWKYWHHR
jgi:hypothetical protein